MNINWNKNEIEHFSLVFLCIELFLIPIFFLAAKSWICECIIGDILSSTEKYRFNIETENVAKQEKTISSIFNRKRILATKLHYINFFL